MKPNIEEIRKMLAAATPGPWNHTTDAVRTGYDYDRWICQMYESFDYGEREEFKNSVANAELIAKAPETISSLCDEVERQAEEIKRLREALIRERDDAMIWDGIGTVNRINIVLESGEALRRDNRDE